jgi:hypothetical protein
MKFQEVIEITSAFDFFEMVHEINLDYLDGGQRNYIQYYRGQSDSNWGVVSSIQRYLLSSFERDIIQEFICKRPNEFKYIDQNRFNIVAKMQHHGLATRLIDMTANPAIALYFACNKNYDTDGEVFLFSTTRDDILKPRELDIIMRFYLEERNNFGHYDLAEYYYTKCLPNYKQDELERAFYFLFANDPIAAMTEWISERMIRQSSVFLIVPFKSRNENWEKYRKENTGFSSKGLYGYLREVGYDKFIEGTKISTLIEDIKGLLIEFHQKGKRFIINANNKRKILRELKTIGICESFIFPELEYEGKEIVDEYLYLTLQK